LIARFRELKRGGRISAFDGARIRTAARRLGLAFRARIKKCDEQKECIKRRRCAQTRTRRENNSNRQCTFWVAETKADMRVQSQIIHIIRVCAFGTWKETGTVARNGTDRLSQSSGSLLLLFCLNRCYSLASSGAEWRLWRDDHDDRRISQVGRGAKGR